MPLLTKDMIKPAKNLWQYFFGIFVMSSLTLPFIWNGPWTDTKRLMIAAVWSFAIWATQMVGHTLIIVNLDKLISWMHRPFLRGILGLLCMVVYASIAFITVQFVMDLIFFQELPEGSFVEQIKGSLYAVKIAFVVSFLATFFGFLSAWKKSEVEKERVKTQMMVHKYNALQNQINPHFLFNSFNVLSELVYENQALAVKFIRQLSDLYRYVLSVKTEDLVPLQKEIDFIKSFNFLLKTRFEQRIEITLDIAAETHENIVPMSLQLLVENAVNHNEATSENPLRISIYREENFIVVANNFQPKNEETSSTKTGLTNIKERYSFVGKEQPVVTQNATSFTVKLPIITLAN